MYGASLPYYTPITPEHPAFRKHENFLLRWSGKRPSEVRAKVYEIQKASLLVLYVMYGISAFSGGWALWENNGVFWGMQGSLYFFSNLVSKDQQHIVGAIANIKNCALLLMLLWIFPMYNLAYGTWICYFRISTADRDNLTDCNTMVSQGSYSIYGSQMCSIGMKVNDVTFYGWGMCSYSGFDTFKYVLAYFLLLFFLVINSFVGYYGWYLQDKDIMGLERQEEEEAKRQSGRL